MDVSRFGTLSPNIDDRRGDVMSALEEARLIMQQVDPNLPHIAAATMPEPPMSRLGAAAGMLDIGPGHERWLSHRPANFAERFVPIPQMDWRR